MSDLPAEQQSVRPLTDNEHLADRRPLASLYPGGKSHLRIDVDHSRFDQVVVL